jgi:hypothetical protein
MSISMYAYKIMKRWGARHGFYKYDNPALIDFTRYHLTVPRLYQTCYDCHLASKQSNLLRRVLGMAYLMSNL